MKIWRKRITALINESINDGGVCRKSLATPGLLNIALAAKAIQRINSFSIAILGKPILEVFIFGNLQYL